MCRNDWILEVMEDIAKFAEINDLPKTREAFQNIEEAVRNELKTKIGNVHCLQGEGVGSLALRRLE